MNEYGPLIEVFSYFPGSPQVRTPPGLKVSKLPAPEGSELEPPEALVTMEPGELIELPPQPRDGDRPLIFASYGRQANLVGKSEMIEAARAANRRIEIHVFDELQGGN